MSQDNRIYLYPQTSCQQTSVCTNNDVQCGTVFPQNCNNNRVQYTQPVPNVKSNIITGFNPQVLNNNYAKNFGITNCTDQKTNPTYYSSDPRLFDSARNQHLLLSEPPISHNVKLANVYNENLRNYGDIKCDPNGNNYGNVNDGQIVYYIGDDRKDAFFRPIFSADVSIQTNLYKDPMDGVQPEYIRGFKQWENPTTIKNANQSYNVCPDFGLTAVSDITYHRDELFSAYEASLQQKKFRYN